MPPKRIFSPSGVFMLVLLGLCGTAAAVDPYVSAGFLNFPAEVQLGAVSAVAVDRDDQVYVLQRGEPPLVSFDAAGNYLRGWGQGLYKVAHGLRVDAAGNIWTTDNGNHVLRKFRRDGTLLDTLGTLDKPASGRDGFRAPDDLAFDSEGNIYVADSGNARIVKLGCDGTYITAWGSRGRETGQFATAHALTIDPQDHIYVADRGNRRVQVYNTDGEHLTQWTGFGNPFGLLWVGEQLLVSEGDLHKIFHIARNGNIDAVWGDPAVLKLPHLMAVNSQGTLFVAEVTGRRVQMFKRP
jgi:DNA-binding beta-propeller fold protein YncE